MLYFFILEFNYLSVHKNRGEKSISYQLWISAAALDHTASRLYTTPKIRYWQKPITASPQLTQNLHIRASHLQWTSSILLSLIRNIYFKEHKTEFCVTFSYPQIFIFLGDKAEYFASFLKMRTNESSRSCLSLSFAMIKFLSIDTAERFHSTMLENNLHLWTQDLCQANLKFH